MSTNAARDAGHQRAHVARFTFQRIAQYQRIEAHAAGGLRYAGQRHHRSGDQVKRGIVEFGRRFVSGCGHSVGYSGRRIDTVASDDLA